MLVTVVLVTRVVVDNALPFVQRHEQAEEIAAGLLYPARQAGLGMAAARPLSDGEPDMQAGGIDNELKMVAGQ